jgi:phytol kinase
MDIKLKRKKLKILAEISRKSWHFFAGLTLIIGYSLVLMNYSKETALLVATFFLLLAMIFEHVRLEHKPSIFRIFNAFFRKSELNSTSGLMTFLLSGILTFAVFDFWIAFVAMMMMLMGDAFSAAIGMMFGKRKLRKKKTYVGTGAGLVANLITGAVLMYEIPEVFIPMAITATIVELMTNKLDDNLTVPVSTAFVGHLILYII